MKQNNFSLKIELRSSYPHDNYQITRVSVEKVELTAASQKLYFFFVIVDKNGSPRVAGSVINLTTSPL